MKDSKIDYKKKSEEIQDHLSNVNMEAWFVIYENYVKKDKIKKDSTTENDLPDNSS